MTQTVTKHIEIPGAVIRELPRRSPRELVIRPQTLPPLLIEILPRSVSIVCYQGDGLALRLIVNDTDGNPADLSHVLPKSQVRPRPESEEVYAEFWGFQIVDNVIDCGLTSQQMGAIPAGRWAWDFQATEFGVVKTWVAGSFTVTAEVTR